MSATIRSFLLASAAVMASPKAMAQVGQLNDMRAEVQRIARQMADQRQRLLHFPGGILFEYEVSVEQDPAKPSIVYPKGFKGVLAIRWPKLRSLVDGEMAGVKRLQADGTWAESLERTVREANYDFVAQRTVSRDDRRLGQIGGFRTPFSAQFCFPLVFQDFVETSQQYVFGKDLRTDQWLPNCIKQYSYRYAGQDQVAGLPCVVLERPGWDKIWIDTAHGFLVARRERAFGPGRGLRERTENLAPRELAPGLWFPTEQCREEFESGSDTPACRLTLRITHTRVGDLQDADLEVVFPKDIERVEDMTTRQIHQGGGTTDDLLERAVERETGAAPSPPSRWGMARAILGGTALFLAATIVVVWRLRR